jgi:hypothetical protein
MYHERNDSLTFDVMTGQTGEMCFKRVDNSGMAVGKKVELKLPSTPYGTAHVLLPNHLVSIGANARRGSGCGGRIATVPGASSLVRRRNSRVRHIFLPHTTLSTILGYKRPT